MDTVVAGDGTISGLARKIKERPPKCNDADLVGSILAKLEQLNQLQVDQTGFYEVEGDG